MLSLKSGNLFRHANETFIWVESQDTWRPVSPNELFIFCSVTNKHQGVYQISCLCTKTLAECFTKFINVETLIKVK